MLKFLLGILVGLILFPLASLTIARLGRLPVEATADPPSWESFLMRRVVAASISRQAPRMQNPVPATSDHLRAGMKLFLDDCAVATAIRASAAAGALRCSIRASRNSA